MERARITTIVRFGDRGHGARTRQPEPDRGMRARTADALSQRDGLEVRDDARAACAEAHSVGRGRR
jgi:hypothetical protein